MQLNRRKVVHSLLSKGFLKSDAHHRYLYYYNLAGVKTPIRTKVSHGAKGKDLNDFLIGEMSKQCHLSKNQFLELVNCPLGREKFEEILTRKDLI